MTANLPSFPKNTNPNVPGLAGLDAALTWLLTQPPGSLRNHEIDLTQVLWDALAAIPGVTLCGPNPQQTARTGVISLQLAAYAPQDAAAILDEHFGVQCRAGLHCAPGVHRSLGTLEAGGTLRFSLSPFASCDDIESVAAAVRAISDNQG
ncbi:MAG: hypothetical protein B7Z55_10895 [Planctomycetales bacterium 12-60-4]|nr:MAG: hypothetical protein B7Z55_10895 [Planctomycetales bacterium 12-60-4]